MFAFLVLSLTGAASRNASHHLGCPSAREGRHPRSTKLDLDKARHDHLRTVAAIRPRHRLQFNPQHVASQYDQDALLVQIFDAIGVRSHTFVEWGARRPNILNSAHFRVHCGWCGLLLDGAPGASPNKGSQKYPGLSGLLSAPDTSCARLRQAFITPTNVNHVLARHSAPSPLDLLTVDMDGQDFWVLSAFDFQRYRPRVIAVEFSSHFASHQFCTTRRDAAYIWDFKTDAEVGTSLALWNWLLACRGFQYVGQANGEHGIWVQRSELAAADLTSPELIPTYIREGRGFSGGGQLQDIVCNVTAVESSPMECALQRVGSAEAYGKAKPSRRGGPGSDVDGLARPGSSEGGGTGSEARGSGDMAAIAFSGEKRKREPKQIEPSELFEALHRILGNLSMAQRVPFFRIDTEALREDVDRMSKAFGNGSIHYNNPAEAGWRLLNLRTCGGRLNHDKPCKRRNQRYLPTPVWSTSTYVSRLLAPIEGAVQRVRISNIFPKQYVNWHRDEEIPFQRGQARKWHPGAPNDQPVCRVHLIVTRPPGAILQLGTAQLQMQPGEIWCGDFSLPHMLFHAGTTKRTTVLIDVRQYATKGLSWRRRSWRGKPCLGDCSTAWLGIHAHAGRTLSYHSRSMPAGRNQGRCALAVGAWRSNPGHPSAHVLRVRWHRRSSEPQVAPDDRVRAGSSRRHGEAGRACARLQSLPTYVSRAKVVGRGVDSKSEKHDEKVKKKTNLPLG